VNNIRKLIEILSVNKKEVYERLGISPQAFNNYLNYKNAKKYNSQIALILGVDEKYLTKEELAEEDLYKIISQRSSGEIMPQKVKMLQGDIELSKTEFLAEMDSIDRTLDLVDCLIQIDKMKIPKSTLERVEITINDNEVNFEAGTGEKLVFLVDDAIKIIKRNNSYGIYIIVFMRLVLKLTINP